MHPGYELTPISDGLLGEDVYPPDDTSYATVLAGAELFCDRRLVCDRPSQLRCRNSVFRSPLCTRARPLAPYLICFPLEGVLLAFRDDHDEIVRVFVLFIKRMLPPSAGRERFDTRRSFP